MATSDVPPGVLERLVREFTEKYEIDIQVLAPWALDRSALDLVRDQYVAEDLVVGLMQSYPKRPPEESSVIIGLLTDDVYIRDRPDWNWAFGVRDDAGYAVISSARMGSLEGSTAPIILSRLRKMVLRDIGVLFYGLPLNHDPLSVLYADVLGVDDLDRMGEEFCGSDCPGLALARPR